MSVERGVGAGVGGVKAPERMKLFELPAITGAGDNDFGSRESDGTVALKPGMAKFGCRSSLPSRPIAFGIGVEKSNGKLLEPGAIVETGKRPVPLRRGSFESLAI